MNSFRLPLTLSLLPGTGLFLFLSLISVFSFAIEPPGLINHQGRIAVNGVNHDGPGFFKFSLVKDAGTGTEAVLWHQDGTGTGNAEPATAVEVAVVKGHYALLLGADHAIPSSTFSENDHVSLRIWFSADGTTFEQLAPDRRVTSVGYAMSAANAETAATAETATVANSFSGEGLTISGGNIVIPNTTTTTGRIDYNGNPYIHSYSSNSFFAGEGAGNLTTTGFGNTGVGKGALKSLTNGSRNSGFGRWALANNTSGERNTALGQEALRDNTTGSENTAAGRGSLFKNTTGSFNTAVGNEALLNNTEGYQNTAVGRHSMRWNTTGLVNTAVGAMSLQENTEGKANTALGVVALQDNTTGDDNTAIGRGSLQNSISGNQNTALGRNTLYKSITGSYNTAIGESAGQGMDNANYNILLGHQAGWNLTSGDHNIIIGNAGVAAEASTIRIGDTDQNRTFIAGIRGVTTDSANALPVLIDSNGQLGTAGGPIDTDPTNELQNWSNLPGIPAAFSDGVDNVDDADASPTNELQNWSNLPGIPAGFSDDVDNVDDADASPTNELQTISLAGNTLSLSNSGGSADLSTIGPWSASGGDVSFTSGDVNVSVLELAAPSATSGIIRSGSDTLIHSFGGTTSFFAGRAAGNLTQTGSQQNTGVGVGALNSLTLGDENTSVGFQALEANEDGSRNTAVGLSAMLNNTSGNDNSAFGRASLVLNTDGVANTAVGVRALRSNVSGGFNVAVGLDSLINSSGSNNIAIGKSAGAALTTGNSNIAIGAPGVAGESGAIRIGTDATHTKAFVAGIRGVTPGQNDGLPVIIDSTGQLGTTAWQEPTPKIWTGGPLNSNTTSGRQQITLEEVAINTANGYISVAPTGEITILKPGIYEFAATVARVASGSSDITLSKTSGGNTTIEFAERTNHVNGPVIHSRFGHIGQYVTNDVLTLSSAINQNVTTNYESYTGSSGNGGTRITVKYLGPN
jgi:hypothetical protein